MTKQATSKIAMDAARAEAHDLLGALLSPRTVDAYVSSFCERFTSAPRVTIFEQARELVAASRTEIEKDAMEILVRRNVANQKTVGLDKLIIELSGLCAAVRIERGRPWGIAIALSELSNAKDPSAYDNVCIQIGASIRKDRGYLSTILGELKSRQHTPTALSLWGSMVRPALGDLSRSYSLSEKESSEITENLTALAVEDCPEAVVQVLPQILEHADDSRRVSFLASPLGQVLTQNIYRASKNQETTGYSKDASILDANERDLLCQIEAALVAARRSADDQVREAEARLEQSLAELRARVRTSEDENAGLRRKLEKSQAEVAKANEKVASGLSQLQKAETDLERHAAEIRQLTREKEHDQSDQRDRQLADLRDKLVREAAKLRDEIVKECRKSPERASEMRMIAVTFNRLHEKLMKMAQVDDERVPRDILAGKAGQSE